MEQSIEVISCTEVSANGQTLNAEVKIYVKKSPYVWVSQCSHKTSYGEILFFITITNDTGYDVKNLSLTDYIYSYYPFYIDYIKMENGYYEQCGDQIYFDGISINKKDSVQICLQIRGATNDEIINCAYIDYYD